MKTKILGGIALLSISAIIAINVSLNLKRTDHSSLLALANVEALASAESGGGWTWRCSTYTLESYDELQYCDELGYQKVHKRWETRACNNGLLSFCYPGYRVNYYDCNGTIYRTLDMTEMSTC